MSNVTPLPRVIRLRDAPYYLGMDVHRFNKEVRPQLQEFSIGKQGIGFDRLDLDAWFEHYKACQGRSITKRGIQLWDVNTYQESLKEETFGTLTKLSSDSEFAKVLAQARSSKRKITCQRKLSN